jgi:hypothetical protein
MVQVVDGHLYPDSTRCVEIATTAAIQVRHHHVYYI